MIDVEKIIREYITKTVHMSLGTAQDGKPWVCEVHFAYDENLNLYFRSKANRRHCLEIAENPSVAGNIVPQYGLEEGCGGAIYYEGEAVNVDNKEERERIFPYFQKCLQKEKDILEEADGAEGTQFYKITVKNWCAFGVFEDAPMQKYELEWNGGENKF